MGQTFMRLSWSSASSVLLKYPFPAIINAEPKQGGDFMDIPGLSVAMSQANVMGDLGIAVLSKALDTVEESGELMIQMMEQSVNPHLGANIDVRV